MTARLITISWTSVTDVSCIGYNISLVQGSPPNSTKTLLAFVNGVTSDSYNYTAVEGTQYQFEVRATDGTNESAPLEIFYPDGTSTYTPTLITPTGKPMMIVRDSVYMTKDEFIKYPNGLKLTTSSTLYTDGTLDTMLSIASEEVNRYTRRHFDVQTIDEVYDGIRIGQDAPRLVTVPLNEGPIQVVNSIWIQVLKWFIPFSLSYLQVFPQKQIIQIVPFLGANYTTAVPIPSAVLMEGLLGKVWVNYTFGYDVIPNAIKMATNLFATKLIGLQENPVGAKDVRFGRNFQLSWDNDHDPIIQQAYRLLDPFRISTFRRP
jgi:hypothetical protein